MRKLQNQAPEAEAPQRKEAPHRGHRREKKSSGRIWINLVLILCIGVMAFCGYQIYSIFSERSKGKELNAQLVHYMQYTPQAADGPRLEVDFEGLQKINPDICAWIYLQGSEINYPVVQGSDNDYYLEHTASGGRNKCGAIFMDYINSPSFVDQKTILYGHRMNNGTMFADLLGYKEQAYYEEHPYLLLATPEQTYVLEVVSAREVEGKRENYRVSFISLEDYLADIQMLCQNSLIQTGVEVRKEEHVVMLSTCVRGNKSNRFAVLTRLVPYEEYDFDA